MLEFEFVGWNTLAMRLSLRRVEMYLIKHETLALSDLLLLLNLGLKLELIS